MIKVEPINQIGEDERGRTYTFNMDRTGEFIVGFRKAGSSSGRHYHKGRSPYKCPEKFMIMQGQATVHWRDIKSERLGSEKLRAQLSFILIPGYGTTSLPIAISFL